MYAGYSLNLLNIFKGTLYTIKNKNIFPTEKDFPDLLPDEYCTTSQQYFKKTSRCLHIANAGYDKTISYLKKDLSNLSYDTKRMSGIYLAIPVFSKGYRPKQGKVVP